MPKSTDESNHEVTISPKEGLTFVRLMMVLSSLWPLFVLWAIRGTKLIPDCYAIVFCVLLIAVPSGSFALRILLVKKNREMRVLKAGDSEDNTNHVLVYLIAILLPLYQDDLETYRDLTATFVALLIIAILIYHLNFHYMNMYFVMSGFRLYKVYPSRESNSFTGQEPFILISKRRHIASNLSIRAYRLSDTVYLEATK